MLELPTNGTLATHLTEALTAGNLHAVQELITFDVYVNGNAIPPQTNFGLNASFFGLKFGDGFGTVVNGGGTYLRPFPQRSFTLVPESQPNVAVWSPDGYATIRPALLAAGTVAFALNSIYVGYLQAVNVPAPGPVTLSGYLQSTPVDTCLYTVTPTAAVAPTLVTTPGCSTLDELRISDTQGQYWFIDSMTVTIIKLFNV